MRDRVKPILSTAILILTTIIWWTSDRLHKLSEAVASAEVTQLRRELEAAREDAARAKWEHARTQVELLACQGQKASGMNVPVQKLPEWDERHRE